MSGQAEDKEGGPDTTVKDSSEHTSTVVTPDAKEESHSTPEKSSSYQPDEQEPPSRHLWVGNVSTSVTEAELAEQFSRFGDIDSVTAYPSRNYAFINFKTVEDGLYAKKGLQGTVLGGLAIRIEFAKGAKPSKHLWIGNISSSVTKEQLEAECKKFGVVDDVRILRDRNCAFVDFTKTDDAVATFENLNKNVFGKDELCVEYVKSQLHPKKDSKSDDQPQADERSTSQSEEPATTFSVKTISEKPKRDRDEPSEILWVGFPICMKIDERKLHKAFSPFGGIERITTFPGRTYAFVQFHSVKAATRAKNVLQGKLFNDPRVSISFAKSEIGPVDHHSRATGSWMPSPSANANMPPLLFSKPAGFANPRNDRFLNFHAFRPNSPSFRRGPEGDMDEAGMFFPNSHQEAGFRDDMARGIRSGPDLNTWGSPALPEGAFIHPRHAPHMQERWNFEEEALGRREPKRPRAADNHSARGGLVELRSPDARDDREAFQVVKAQDYISKVTRMSNSDTMSLNNWEDSEGLKRPTKRPTLGLEMDISRPSKDNWARSGMPVSQFEEVLKWQGVIAKSGTSVCRARCYSIGKMTNFVFPEVVNCTARTSLDMLAKHISEVGEFSLVSFIPHGDLDVESYQDFIVYLSEKNRAAVCKLSQESTLFLVPPSSFVEHFLKVPSDKNIIGVLLKLPQTFPSSAEQTGLFKPMQTTEGMRVVSAESYQKSTPQAPAEHKLPIMAPMQAAFHGIPSTDQVMASHLLLPSRSSLQSSSAAPNFAAAVGVSSTGGLNGSSVRPNNPSIIDDSQSAHMHLPPGYASMQHQHQQHSTPQMGSFSLAPPGDLHPHQEQGMRVNPRLPSPSSQIQNSQLKMQQAQSLSSTAPNYPQQPPLPQYPHPSTQQKQPTQPAQNPLPNVPPSHTEQFSHLASIPLQPFPESVQPINVHPQHASGSHLHHHHPQHQMAPASNFVPIKEQLSLTATQPSHPPPVMQKDDSRGQTTAVDTEQRELLRLAQQKLSEAKGESGEDNKRFQATLELAAALLQQLQQKAKQ